MQVKDQQSAKESYTAITTEESRNVLVDVRSIQEWKDIGVADFSFAPEKLVLCEWRMSPSMNLNENFFSELTVKIDLKKVQNLFFICAAGIRSQEATIYIRSKLKELGSPVECINVCDGFNGNTNKFFSLGNVSGWKPSGLPCCEFDESSYKT